MPSCPVIPVLAYEDLAEVADVAPEEWGGTSSP